MNRWLIVFISVAYALTSLACTNSCEELLENCHRCDEGLKHGTPALGCDFRYGVLVDEDREDICDDLVDKDCAFFARQ